MVVIAIIAGITYASSSVMYSLMKANLDANFGAMILTMKNQLVNCVNDPNGMSATFFDAVNSGPTTPLGRCLLTPSTCYPLSNPASAGLPIRLNGSMAALNPAKTQWAYYTCGGYDTIMPNSGFSRNGSFCSTFSLTNPDPNCPFRFNVTWKPACLDAACTNAKFVFTGELQMSGASDVLNLEAYRFSRTLAKNTVPLEEVGAALVTAANLSGGACVPGKWTPRIFNTIMYDSDLLSPAGTNAANLYPGNGSLAPGFSPLITLTPGKYGCHGWAAAFQVGNHQVRLRITDNKGTRYVYGNNAFSSYNFGFLQTYSDVFAAIDIGERGYIALEHNCEKTFGPPDFGRGLGPGETAPSVPNIFNRVDCVRYE